MDAAPDRSGEDRPVADDGGFTLVELLVVMSILGIIVGSIAVAFTLIVRTTPDTELRIDDARSTRGLATWLAQDTMSSPRFEPEQSPYGGIDVGSRNDCGGAGSNVLHLRWVEDGISTHTYVANYRYVINGTEARIVRYSCSRSGGYSSSNPWSAPVVTNLTSGLDPANVPVVTLNRDGVGDVESVTFELQAVGGEQVLVDTGPRNPTEFF